jgi:O-antigen/teichoic acid export membrane protein
VLRRNIAANAIGGSLSAIFALALIPVQVRLLGVEAYGLLAFVASLQVLLSIFDLGLSPTMTREVSRDTSEGHEVSRMLIRSISLVYWPIGIGLGIVLSLAAPWLAGHWLHLERLSPGTATQALRLAGAVIALRWPVSLYSAAVAGRQRFVALNGMKAAIAGIGAVGGIAVVLATHSLLDLLVWMVLAAGIELAGYLALVLRLNPGLLARRLVAGALPAGIWRYAIGINLINVLAMVLTQSDRILISKLLTIQSLGYYALAYNILTGLALIPGFVTSALFPAFVVRHAAAAPSDLRETYQTATKGLMYAYNLPIWLLAVFGHDILKALTSAATADRTAPLLSVLALGFLCNGAATLAYTASIATGRTSIPIRVNLLAVVVYVPIITLLTLWLGGLGAALSWLLLNLYYLPALLPPVHRLMGVRTLPWLGRSFLPFVGAGLACFGLGKLLLTLQGSDSNGATVLAGAVSALAYLCVGFAVVGKTVRQQIFRSVGEVRLALSSTLSGRS